MDTSEMYIKMCREAKEIQKLRTDEDAGEKNFFRYKNGDMIFYYHDDYKEPMTNFYDSMADDEGGFGYDATGSVWLPRQDQLQEMIDDLFFDYQRDYKMPDPMGMVDHFADFAEEWEWNNRYGFSMEKNWLAFVMKEKFNKTWNGTEWI
jgi:hypothetical protein